ncbi:MAG: metallophosphoesterase family protein [Anaerolineae bacterium]|nr:metallophosphoesterase family protein [Anaerolineae bacterium]
MRYLIISDIHSNLAAFEAVLADAGSFDKVWCLGDVVGYGPDPNECVELLRDLPHVCVVGNHDWAVLGNMDTEDFNPNAKRACLWTRKQLSPSNLEYLETLPKSLVEENFTLAHGSPRQPIWEYILDSSVAEANFEHFDTRFCFVGHTHVPIIYRHRPENPDQACDTLTPSLNDPLVLGEDRLIINPGSVGQPRDGDPRASYAILDPDELTLQYRRIPYPIETTQARMVERGLPVRLIIRLGYGW